MIEKYENTLEWRYRHYKKCPCDLCDKEAQRVIKLIEERDSKVEDMDELDKR